MERIIATFCILFTFSFSCLGQYYENGAEPFLTTWRQIKTEHFQVVYPKGFDSVAQNFTHKLEFVYASCSNSLKNNPKRIPVIIHNQSNVSNASVAWCPSQMDVYTVPSQSQHPQEWFENLAIHEFRHVVQMNSLDQGLTGFMYYLLGEQAVGVVSGLYTPKWLLEGDAVCTETALSTSGRGRQADFSKGLRAQTYDKGVYSYSKAYFGSYKDYVPNYYEMGYFFLANIRRQYGQHMEYEILTRAALHPFSIRPVNRAMIDRTKLNRRELYAAMFDVQTNEWKLKHDREIQTPYDTIAQSNDVYGSYIHGMQVSDSVFFVERTALDRIAQLVKIEQGKEKVIANTSFKPREDNFSTNGNTIVWEETNYNVRWEQKQTSRLYVYDIARNKKSCIRMHNHVYSPAISPSNERIAVAENAEDGTYYLSVYDKKGKNVIKKVVPPNRDAVLQPSWNDNGSKIVFVGLNSAGKRIMEYDVVEDSFNEVLPYSTEDYTSPLYWHEFILYTSSYSGVDNIYAIHSDTKRISRITVGDFGCRYPSVYDSTMVYSNYTSDGYNLAKIYLNPAKWHDIKVVKKENYNLAQMLTNQEGGAVDFSQMSDTIYEVKYYSKLLHAVRIHSWMPFYLSYNGGNVQDGGNGVQLVSQNHLGTVVASTGYRWNRNVATHNYFAKVSYRGFFPVFDFEYNYGTVSNSDTLPSSRIIKTSYRTKDLVARMYVPLNFSSKGYSRSVVWYGQIQKSSYERISCPVDVENYYAKSLSLNLWSQQLSISNMRAKATRDIYSRWGQSVNLGYSTSAEPVDGTCDGFAQQFFADMSIFMPGLLRSHSLNFYGGIEYDEHYDEIKEKNLQFVLNRLVQTPRGFIDTLALPMSKHLFSCKVNYAFPFAYPDKEWGDFMYLQRLRCNMFFDYALLERKIDYMSFGAEVFADFHLCNFIVPFNAGLRWSYLPNQAFTTLELLFTTNFTDI